MQFVAAARLSSLVARTHTHSRQLAHAKSEKGSFFLPKSTRVRYAHEVRTYPLHVSSRSRTCSCTLKSSSQVPPLSPCCRCVHPSLLLAAAARCNSPGHSTPLPADRLFGVLSHVCLPASRPPCARTYSSIIVENQQFVRCIYFYCLTFLYIGLFGGSWSRFLTLSTVLSLLF